MSERAHERNDARDTILDLDALVAAVTRGATHRDSPIHGEAHWRCVAWTGAQLVRATPDADRDVIFLFGLIHDAKRLNDGHDPLHGHRAAAFALELHGRFFRLDSARLKRLHRAIHEHADGRTTNDPTVGVCWDADRLNLWRLGVRPRESLLSTEAARRADTIERAAQLGGQHQAWRAIVESYGASALLAAPSRAGRAADSA